MKNIKKITTLLIISFFSIISGANAQHQPQPKIELAGSFQFVNDVNRRFITLVLQSNTQKFEFKIDEKEKVFIANLLPDRYSLVVNYNGTGMQGVLRENINIESGKTIICHIKDIAQKGKINSILNFTTTIDRSAVPLCNDYFRVETDRRGNDNYHGDKGRNEHIDNHPTVVIPVPPVVSVVNPVDFNKIYNAVKVEKFSDTKMQTLQILADYNTFFTTEQVKQLALLFSHDNDKLECVKYLLNKVVDTNNLPLLKDVFSFASTKDEYLEFLRKRR
jgi:hypothetical protein